MNELWKTLTFVLVALALTGFAFVSTRDRTKVGAEFNDQGEPFFPDFQDPLACTDLEVVEFEPSTATASRFRVMFKDKQWVIPSHYNYPADAKDRFFGKDGRCRHGRDQGHDPLEPERRRRESMGVIDPLDAKVSDSPGSRQANHTATSPGEGARRHRHR